MAGRQAILPTILPNGTILELSQRFIDHHKAKSAPRTVQFYYGALGGLKVCDLH